MSAIVYTDGSCDPNPGPGGYGFISLDPTGDWYVSGGEKQSTNNRMELMAVIEAISFHASSHEITIFTDSQLTINCATGLWRRKMNTDLWELYDCASKGKNIIFKKVKAHNGDHYNELVDKLAKKEMREVQKKLIKNKKSWLQ